MSEIDERSKDARDLNPFLLALKLASEQATTMSSRLKGNPIGGDSSEAEPPFEPVVFSLAMNSPHIS